mgnify:CR=1 FL=1
MAAALSASSTEWTSDVTGRPVASRTDARMRSPSSRPGPRNERAEVRLALSNDALKMYGTPQRRAISCTAAPTSVDVMDFAMDMLIQRLKKTKTNVEFLMTLKE